MDDKQRCRTFADAVIRRAAIPILASGDLQLIPLTGLVPGSTPALALRAPWSLVPQWAEPIAYARLRIGRGHCCQCAWSTPYFLLAAGDTFRGNSHASPARL
jgi:hypothetical protein